MYTHIYRHTHTHTHIYIYIHTHTMIYYSDIKVNEIMFSVTTWKDIEGIMLNEISSERDI